MIISLKWLRDYVDYSLSVEELAHGLTMVGLEVEGIQRQSAGLENVVTGLLTAIKPHPKADRLRLCEVGAAGRTHRVVCGAPNLHEGDVVILALPGAQLASGMTVQEAQIRGELSLGMLCSQKELGLGDDASGLWILPDGTPVGVPLAEALGLDDTIMEVSITPNRGDCLSILGIAREVSAITGSPLRYPVLDLQEEGPPVDSLATVTIDDPEGCPRYTARVVCGVTVGPSPAWLKTRLEAVGIRSINNIVDVTNTILMEMGQPLHAFDYDRLRDRRIVVRPAREGERFTTLDGVERTLFSDTLLICDGQGPVAVAGIMGGLNSEIVSETRNVLIESAWFEPIGIRRSGKKIGLRSESSYRFERGVDPEGVVRALDRAAQLMCELGGGKVARGRIDAYPRPFEAPELILRVGRTNRFLGTQLGMTEMATVLRSIEMQVQERGDDTLRVIPPSFRPDITREVDLGEEVARLVGYDRIPVTSPQTRVHAEPVGPHMRSRQEVKNFFEGVGFFEVINYSFVSQESLGKLRLDPEDSRLHPVQIKNPLSEEQGVMRTSLIPGLLHTTRYNFDHRNENVRIFELSKVFLPRTGELLPHEPHHLAGIMTGCRHPHLLYGGGDEEVDYTDVKGVLEEVLDLFFPGRVDYRAEELPAYMDPLRAASVHCEGQCIGTVGKLHPEVQEAFDLKKSVYVFEVDFDRVFSLRHARPSFRPLPKFPSVARDMALVMDEAIEVQAPRDFIETMQEPLLELVEVFDIYRNPHLGQGKKSVGYRLVYRATDRNLTDEEVNTIHGGIVSRVLIATNATLR